MPVCNNTAHSSLLSYCTNQTPLAAQMLFIAEKGCYVLPAGHGTQHQLPISGNLLLTASKTQAAMY
jgi:hypothetical protein